MLSPRLRRKVVKVALILPWGSEFDGKYSHVKWNSPLRGAGSFLHCEVFVLRLIIISHFRFLFSPLFRAYF